MTLVNKNLYIISKGVVSCQDINTNTVKYHRHIIKDTQVHRAIEQTAANVFKQKGNSGAIEPLRDLILLNITAADRVLYIGFRFRLGTHPHVRFGIMEYDSALHFKDIFFFIQRKETLVFALPPYHEMYFSGENELWLPLMYKDVTYQRFIINKKEHKISYTPAEKGIKPGTYKTIQVDLSNRTYFDPMFYPVSQSNLQWFFRYPYPILYRNIDSSFIDPYNLKMKADKIDLNKSTVYPDYNKELYFKNTAHSDTTLMAAGLASSYLYMAVAEKGNYCLLQYNTVSGQYKKYKLPCSGERHYFYIKNNLCIVLKPDNTIQYWRLSDLTFE